MNRLIYPLLLIIILTLGCSFKIKNTEGLRLAYEDIDLASSKGVELKHLKNVSEKERQETADLYRNAKKAINGYLKKSIAGASDYVVDEPAESYKVTNAHKDVEAFEKKVNDLRNLEKLHLETLEIAAAAWVPVATTVLGEIIKLNNERQKAAYERFVKTVEGNMMKNFEELPNNGTKK